MNPTVKYREDSTARPQPEPMPRDYCRWPIPGQLSMLPAHVGREVQPHERTVTAGVEDRPRFVRTYVGGGR